MSSTLEAAIAKINSIGDRLCENQVYCFDDYEYDPQLGIGDATAVCNRLGIPVTDELILEYPARATFSPMPVEEIAALEEELGATIPDDYKELLGTFGGFHLPGDCAICLATNPMSLTSWRGFEDAQTSPILAISDCHLYADGDLMGFLRNGKHFGPALFLFDHEVFDPKVAPMNWSKPLADSLAEFVVSYIDSLDE